MINKAMIKRGFQNENTGKYELQDNSDVDIKYIRSEDQDLNIERCC